MMELHQLSDFHFLRPWWLLAVFPVLFLCWRLYIQKIKQGAWQSVIDPEFKSVLLSDTVESQPVQWPIFGLAILGIITSLALAGPTWQEVKLPAEKNRQATVIVLDLSLSMLADDVKPNRLTRVRYKLHDFLQAHPEIPVGLVGYAGSAHTITPIAEDNAPLLNLLPTLNPILMPAFGSDPLTAMQKAVELLEGAHIQKGQIIWITDDIEVSQIPELKSFFQKHPLQLNIMIVGTETGGPIALPEQGLLKDEQGQIVMPKLPKTRLYQLASELHADLTELTLNEADINRLLPHFTPAATDDEDQKTKDYAAWLDQGAWLLWLLLPLVALGYRRGWFFSWVLVGGLLLPIVSYSPQSFAQTEQQQQDNNIHLLDVFKTPDQQGYEHWQQHDFAGAEDRFESPAWKGASFYRLGDYAQAAKAFALDDTARGKYNLGNALAKMGKFNEAKSAYESALKMNPKMENAQQNLALIEKLLQKPEKPEGQKEGNSENSSEQNQNDAQSNHQANSPNNTPANKGSLKDEPLPSEQPPKNNAASQQADQTQAGLQGQQDQATGKPNESGNQPKNSAKSRETEGAENSGAKEGMAAEDSEQLLDKDTQEPSNQPNKLADQKMDPTQDAQAINQALRAQQEAEQAKQAWLQQIPDEPGLFLKRKFDYQYQNQKNQPNPIKSW